MADQLPSYIISMMADRAWRMQHFIWHQVRNNWLFYGQEVQAALRNIGWEPPRPARRPGIGGRPEIILDNDSGEDFLFMHREMIKVVNDRLNGDASYPRVVGWPHIPAPNDPHYPVPPAWDTGDAQFNEYLRNVKSNQMYTQFSNWEREFRGPDVLRRLTLGQLGARIEFTVHNQMHMRWCAEPMMGTRPNPDPADPEAIDPVWDAPEYDWLGDTYSSHVNHHFWKLHGWVDDCIDAWAAANEVQDIEWKGTWVGKMPSHGGHHSFAIELDRHLTDSLGHDHGHGDVRELTNVIRLIASTGQLCEFYDEVLIAPLSAA